MDRDIDTAVADLATKVRNATVEACAQLCERLALEGHDPSEFADAIRTFKKTDPAAAQS